MKVDKSHDMYFAKSSKEKENKKANDCRAHNDFDMMLKQIMKKDVEDEKVRLYYTNKRMTSLFFEKKVGKNRTDIFDTLIDI